MGQLSSIHSGTNLIEMHLVVASQAILAAALQNQKSMLILEE